MLHELLEINRPTQIQLEAACVPLMRKTNNPYYGEIEEHLILEGLIGFNYENRVNHQRAREMLPPTFRAAPRQWGIRIRNSPLVYHNKRFYLEVLCEKLILKEYRYIGTYKIVEDVEQYIIKSDSNRQGLDSPIILRDFNLENIIQWQKIGRVVSAR